MTLKFKLQKCYHCGKDSYSLYCDSCRKKHARKLKAMAKKELETRQTLISAVGDRAFFDDKEMFRHAQILHAQFFDLLFDLDSQLRSDLEFIVLSWNGLTEPEREQFRDRFRMVYWSYLYNLELVTALQLSLGENWKNTQQKAWMRTRKKIITSRFRWLKEPEKVQFS